ncbi:hypothetical protein [Alloactinosynnema sp. L-07]|uniref:hypothetical protein n=1 Tax=Alloactinosynnema sp. L-07 TaxID=1653480 RepID=UPI00065F0B9C|nr:hypothetical protein [Alloactinosynnema sp. L-07]CRK61461.1 hypothetical protein [Alloactinosynnema sp. L-07]
MSLDIVTRRGPRTRRSPSYFEALFVVGLAVIATWVIHQFAPPSLIRDGEVLPVAMGSRHTGSGHHGSAPGELVPPSPVSTEPLPSFFGSAFLAFHVLVVLLVLAVPLARRLNARGGTWFTGLVFAGLSALAVGIAAMVTAQVIYQDAVTAEQVLAGGLEAARYGFVAALAIALLFGVPGSVAGPSGEASE